jgi:tetratricopeptide (TPR) repeat protein
VKLRHDRLIPSLLLCCSMPFVAVRAIATEPALWVQTQSIADLQGRPNFSPGQSKQVRKNQQTVVNILRRTLKSYQEPNDQVDERNERLFRSGFLIAQTLSTQEAWQLFKQANEQIDNNNAQEAIKLLNIAKNIFEGDGDIHGEVATLISLGTACMQLQSCDQTLNYYQRARMIVEEIKQHDDYYYLVTLITAYFR